MRNLAKNMGIRTYLMEKF